MKDSKQGARRLGLAIAIVTGVIVLASCVSGCGGGAYTQYEAQAEPVGLQMPELGRVDVVDTTLTVVEKPEVTP